MNKPENPSVLIKLDLRCEIEEWIAAGNVITVLESKQNECSKNQSIANVKSRESERNGKMSKRSKLGENYITAKEIHKFNEWLNIKKGRMNALSDVLDCTSNYITQIRNQIINCSKGRFEEICFAMRAVEISEKFDE